MATYIARGAGGLETYLAEELVSFGIDPGPTERGAVLFEAPEFPSSGGIALLRGLSFWARGIDRVGLLLVRAEVDGLRQIAEQARAGGYRRLLDAGRSFAVRAQRRGEHDFGSLDVARAVGAAVIDSVVAAGGPRPPVSLGDPDVILRAEVLGRSFRLWLDATGDAPLYRRDYRRQLHPASARASMAHLLLRVAGWDGEPLLDPMAGIGTIPIEAGLYALGIAPGTRRGTPYAIDRLLADGRAAPLEAGDTDGFAPPAPLLGPHDELDVRGIERYEHHVQGAWLNLAAAGPLPGVRIEHGDACRLERNVDAGRYRLAVLNPPFGRRIGSTGMVRDLYRRFARSGSCTGIERVVTLAENRTVMSGALEDGGFDVVDAIAVQYGDLPAWVISAARRTGS
jgi:23S rRNA G2445 N2-methylase RlmL